MLNLNELHGIKTNLNRCLLVACVILFNSVLPEGVYHVYTFAAFQVSVDMHACRIVFLHKPCLLCVCIMSICMNAFMQACEWTFGVRVTDPFAGVNMCVRACRHGQSTMAVTLMFPSRVYPAVSVKCFYLSIVTYTSHISIQIYMHLDFDITVLFESTHSNLQKAHGNE